MEQLQSRGFQRSYASRDAYLISRRKCSTWPELRSDCGIASTYLTWIDLRYWWFPFAFRRESRCTYFRSHPGRKPSIWWQNDSDTGSYDWKASVAAHIAPRAQIGFCHWSPQDCLKRKFFQYGSWSWLCLQLTWICFHLPLYCARSTVIPSSLTTWSHREAAHDCSSSESVNWSSWSAWATCSASHFRSTAAWSAL